MNERSTPRAATLLGWVLVALLFVIIAYLSVAYVDTLQTLVSHMGWWGMPLYVLFGCITTVVAPLSSAPLIPAAVAVWGPLVAATLTTLGWTLGSVFAFLLARRFGYEQVRRFASLRSVQRYAAALPQQNLFVVVVLMRIVVPVDALSYALGLFSSMRVVPYTIATLLGTMPFAFIVSFALRAPVWLQAGVAISMAAVAASGWHLVQRARVPHDGEPDDE